MLPITIIGGMQIKTAMKYHSNRQNGYYQKDKKQQVLAEEKETLVPCWWAIKSGQPPLQNSTEVHKKIKIQLPYGSGMPLLGINQ